MKKQRLIYNKQFFILLNYNNNYQKYLINEYYNKE